MRLPTAEETTAPMVAETIDVHWHTLWDWTRLALVGPSGPQPGRGFWKSWSDLDVAEARVFAHLNRLGFPRSRWLRVRSQVRACLTPPSPACLFVRSDDTVHVGEPSLLPELLGSGVVWAVPL